MNLMDGLILLILPSGSTIYSNRLLGMTLRYPTTASSNSMVLTFDWKVERLGDKEFNPWPEPAVIVTVYTFPKEHSKE